MVRLNRTYYSLLKFTSKIFKIVSSSQNSSKLHKFHAIRPHSPRITRNSHILLTYSTLCFRHLPQQRALRNSSELRKFRAIRPHSPRITRNLHHLLTLHLTFQMPTSGRELLKIPANQARFAQFAQLPHELREFHAFRSKLIHIYFTSFRSLTINREPRKIGANQPDFAQFTHNSSELRKIR